MRHFLLDCPKYAYERWALLKSCKAKQQKLSNLLNEKTMMVPLANYIQATRRFKEGTGEKKRGDASRIEEEEAELS